MLPNNLVGRHLFAAWVIPTAIAASTVSMPGLLRLFDFPQPGPVSHHLANPRHDPVAYDPLSNGADPFHDESEMDERHSGRQ